MRLHKGKASLLGIAVFIIVFAVCATLVRAKTSTFIGASANPAYAPQTSRNAEQAGHSDYSQTEINNIAQNVGIMTIPKFADNFNVQKHFEDARKIVDTAKTYGNNIKVLEYYNSAFWYKNNFDGWKPYSDSFKTDWYLKDAAGNPVPFYGIGNTVSDGNPPVGYMLDLSNPAYRAWAEATIVQWMKAAPFSGVQFDSANVLLGNVSRGNVTGGSTWNDLLCTRGYTIDGAGNCPRVAQWNNGLASLLSETSAALHPMGDFVRYNGIAPSDARGPSRNLGLLTNADGTSDEDFCYHAQIGGGRFSLNPLTDDIAIMQQIAAQNKIIFEITNYQTDDNLKYGSYCLGGFLMGWQPGSSYWIYHQGYGYDINSTYPNIAEQNLNLGNPAGQYSAGGPVLSRTFQNGYVVVNNSDAAASYNLPSKLIQFSDGKQGATYMAGTKLSLPARSGAFFLNDSYVNPAGSSGGTTNPVGINSGLGSGGNNNSAKTQSTTKTQAGGSLTTDGVLDGRVNLETPAIDGVVKVEYYIDGKLIRTVTKFPDSGSIDTADFSNGKHVLLTKYYHTDGTITSSTKDITITNPTLRQKLVSTVKRLVLPVGAIMMILIAAFYVFHRYGFLIPRWFYRHDASPKDGPKPAPAVYHPGVVIAPSNLNVKDPKE